VLVGVGSGQSLGVDNLEDGVDTETLVGPDGSTDTVHEGLGEVGGVDSTGEESGVIVVEGLSVDNWK
jgi:hypothetical protein